MLKDKRKELISYIKDHADYIKQNSQALDIYEGNLLPYVDKILQSSLSPEYYQTIKHRSLPINILQRFIDKVSTVYINPPERKSEDAKIQEFVDFYADEFDMDQVGLDADQYSNLFKSYALEPYINLKGEPKIRVLAPNQFIVYSDSEVSPEEETVFIKFMGQKGQDEDSVLLFAYTDTEFDAFYMNGTPAPEYLIENQGVNAIGVIPFVYGKRQKNKLIPTLDSDMLAITKSIPVMLVDAAGAQLYQSFSIIWGVDVKLDNPKMSPNAFWSMKSDRESDKNPQIGTIKPEADTEKIMAFVANIFILWLETKGVRVGSVGNVDSTAMSSGIAKIIDEMDAYAIVKKSAMWFEEDEEELWNEKLPAIHNYWIKTGQLNASKYPAIIPDGFDVEVEVNFEKPEPMQSRTQLLADIKSERDLGTMTLKQAIEKLHPKYTEEQILEVLNGEVSDKNDNKDTKEPGQNGEVETSGVSN